MAPENQPSKLNQTLMSQVAREKEIAFDGDLYQKGVEQFKANMSLLLAKYQQAGIPVLLGNLISNESDQTPLSTVGKVEWPSYKNNVNNNTPAKTQQEVDRLSAMLAQDKSTENYYKLALNLQKNKQFSKAKQAFILAKDHDLLRFRAPSEFNTVIEDLATEYNALLVDNTSNFNANSINGIIGEQLILEHLHPTVDGYFLLAENYIDVINKHHLIGTALLEYPKNKARVDVPVSIIDKRYGDFVIAKLMKDFPFTLASNKNNNEVLLPKSRPFEHQALIGRIKKDNWLAIQKKLFVQYQQHKEIAEAAKIAGSISTAMVVNHQASYIAGQLYQQLNDWQIASYYHEKALNAYNLTTPEKVKYLLTLAQDYFFLKNYEDCLKILQQANEITTTDSKSKQRILQYIGKVKQAQARA